MDTFRMKITAVRARFILHGSFFKSQRDERLQPGVSEAEPPVTDPPIMKS